MFNASNSVRLFLFILAVIIMLGNALSGFAQIHWFAYVLPSLLLLAALTGVCPGLLVSKKLLSTLGIKE